MPFYNRRIAQLLHFLWNCDLWWRSEWFKLVSNYRVQLCLLSSKLNKLVLKGLQKLVHKHLNANYCQRHVLSNQLSEVLSFGYWSCNINLVWASTNQHVMAVYWTSSRPIRKWCLFGLVVKASASRAANPEFESRLWRDFSGSSHTSDLKIGTLVAPLPGAWHYRVNAKYGQPGVSILCSPCFSSIQQDRFYCGDKDPDVDGPIQKRPDASQH